MVSRNMAIESKLMPGGIGDDTNIASSWSRALLFVVFGFVCLGYLAPGVFC